jgi:hypothetical protein
MADLDLWPRLVLAILATWRVTHLLVREDGPGTLFARARSALDDAARARAARLLLLHQPVGRGAARHLGREPAARRRITWLALSGAACLCERIGQRDVVVQPLPEPIPGEDDGMLRTPEPEPGDRDGVAATGR